MRLSVRLPPQRGAGPSLRRQARPTAGRLVDARFVSAWHGVRLEAACGVNGAGRGLERMTRYPNGDKPAAGYRCGVLAVVVRGIPWVAAVEAEPMVQDIEIDDGEDAAV